MHVNLSSMKKTFKAYIAYINDNPEGYWFRRKIFGWGWTPATREGWLVIISFLAVVLLIAWRAEGRVVTDGAALRELILPVILAAALLIGICYKTGEPPRWQWRIPSKYFKD